MTEAGTPGLFIICKSQLGDVAAVLSETMLLIDEADGVLFKEKAPEQLADASAIVGLSATIGGDRGIKLIRHHFKPKYSVNDILMSKLAFNPSLIVHRWHDLQPADLLKSTKKRKAVECIARAIVGGPRFDKHGEAIWCDGPETCEQSVQNLTDKSINFNQSAISQRIADVEYLPTVVIGSKQHIAALFSMLPASLE